MKTCSIPICKLGASSYTSLAVLSLHIKGDLICSVLSSLSKDLNFREIMYQSYS